VAVITAGAATTAFTVFTAFTALFVVAVWKAFGEIGHAFRVRITENKRQFLAPSTELGLDKRSSA
jgi:hypothetical protein